MVDPLSISASIVALLQLSSTVVQYVVAVKGAPEDRGRIHMELASIDCILIELQDQADKQDDDWSSTLQSLKEPGGPLDHFWKALKDLKSKLAPPATTREKMGKAMKWPFQKGEIKEILDRIERAKTLLSLARQNDHIKLSRAIKNETHLIHHEVDKVATGVREIRTSQLTDEHLKIIKWLDAPDPWTNFNKALKDRNSKTGSWFIGKSEYADWKTTRGSFIWLHGIPGCGKTILSSTILENVLSQHAINLNSAVLFFYFDFNDANKQQHEKMLRSLIRQLSEYYVSSFLQNLYSSSQNGNRQPTEDILLMTLRQMMASLGDIYIILDALDECVERRELLEDIETFVSWKDVNSHIITTSRMEKDIDEALTPLVDSRNQINIQTGLIDADIRIYVEDRLSNDKRFRRWQKNPEAQSEIKATLTRKANGMFRWAVCQLDLLGDCLNLLELRQDLASLPKTLDDTYARIISNIDKRSKDRYRPILKILRWLTFSARPLRLEELAEVVAIDVDKDPRFDKERGLSDRKDILTMCSSLITFTTEAYDAADYASSSELVSTTAASDTEGHPVFVRLAHFSVKEYLISDRIQLGDAAHYSIREIESHGVLAEDCIAYLLQFDRPCSVTSETLELFPLARYAAKFWTHHAEKAEKRPIETATRLGMELLMSGGGGLLNWIRIADPDYVGGEDLDRGLDTLAPPLYYASLAGLFEQVKLLMRRNVDVNAQGGNQGNALQAASYSGHSNVVQFLLDNGADVNAGHPPNAIHLASSMGHEKIVRILLDKGAGINSLDENQESALQSASSRGNENVVKLLLDKGADVNSSSGYGGSALQDASYCGYDKIVKMLLNKGADVNAPGSGYWGSVLQAASEEGYETIVKMLLDKGADVNAPGTEGYCTALQGASRRGHEGVVKMLLDKGAEINAPGSGNWGTALQIASRGRHESVVKMLLDNGADINTTSNRCPSNALQLASESGHENIVKILLEKGADVNATNHKSPRNALQRASESGHETIVEMLLAKGAIMPEEESESQHDLPFRTRSI